MNKLEARLQETGVILADGAMGTMLITAGLRQGEPPPLWNLEHPERVAQVHRQYIEAGSRLLLTNTSGANRFRMANHDSKAPINDLNRAGARILRSEVEADGGTSIVAGDIDPSGQLMAPYGELTFEEAKDGFAEQAAALIDGGVDVIWIETMADLEEVRAAFEGVRDVSVKIPILTTMSFDTHGRTMMGVSPKQAVISLTSMGAVAVGGDCGKGPQEILSVIFEMHRAVPEAVLVAKANAGIPELVDGKTVYGVDPATMAEYALQARAAGAQIIGACCGSTPAHIKAMAEVLTFGKND